MPKKRNIIQFDNSMIDNGLLSKLIACVTVHTYQDKHIQSKESLNLSSLLRHFRNGIAHSHFEPIAEKQSQNDTQLKVHEIKISDRKNKQEIFEAVIPVDLLRDFFIAFADIIINAQ